MQRSLFFITCFICGNSIAQQYPFVNYSPKDGLVNSRVRNIEQDSKGRMYFLTYGGLSIYDGTKFTNYTMQDGLSADVVNDILEAGKDSIWIACNTNKLCYLKSGKIHVFKTADNFYPIINKFIKSADGNIYAAADEGLFIFQKNKFVRLTIMADKDKEPIKFLFNALEWKDLILIITDTKMNTVGLPNFFVYNKKTGNVLQQKKNKVHAMCITPGQKIFIADEKGMHQLDTAALLHNEIKFIPLPYAIKTPAAPPGFIYSDKQDNLWMFHTAGIICIDNNGNTRHFSAATGLSSNNFSNIFQDRENIIWITMDGSGADKLVEANIELFKKYNDEDVHNMYADESSDSVYLYNFNKKKISTIYNKTTVGTMNTELNIFPASFYVRNMNSFVSDGSQLFLLQQNANLQLSKSILYETKDKPGFGEFFFDKNNELIIGRNASLLRILNEREVAQYPLSYTDQVIIDSNNRLWAATRSGEFHVLKLNPGNPRYFELLIKFRYDSVFPGVSARSLTIDRFNNIWMGTRYHGIFCMRFNEKNQLISFQRFTLKDGLSDNFVIHLVCDKNNNIWASTASGLDKIYYSNGNFQIKNITRDSHIYKYIRKTFITRSGVVWSHTSDNSIIRIEKQQPVPQQPPDFFITSLTTHDSTIYDFSESGSFSYRQNSFAFSVSAPTFYNEKGIQYSYLLQGTDSEQWSEPSNNSTFNFISLHPGNYTLKVKARFPAGIYPEQSLEYFFTIHPPWWQTTWFRLLVALLIIGVILLIVRLYYNRKLERQRMALEKQQAIEKERTRIASDIHDDLGSGLSRIRYLGETIRHKKMQEEDILPEIEKISHFSDEMVDKMSEIIWALNEKNDSLEAMISYIRLYAVEYLSENNVTCNISLPDHIPDCIVKGETRRNIFLSVKEGLHNIVKHAAATAATVRITLNPHIEIAISDNGKGINRDSIKPFSNGIMNIEKRMLEAGGSVEFINGPGTTLLLRATLL